jgi:uncharacterized protein
MQQIIVIHGGTTFSDYDNYLEYLANKPLHVDRLTYSPMWKEQLQDQLGAGYQVLLPAMPNKTNARYSEWKIWFEHLTSIFTDECILIGHSLGAIFLAKYLSENVFPRTIKATILVAAPYDDESEEDLTDFKIETISDTFIKQAGRIVFFNGPDDPVISMSDLNKYKTSLPSAEFNLLPAPDHFMRTDFPQLTALLKEL